MYLSLETHGGLWPCYNLGSRRKIGSSPQTLYAWKQCGASDLFGIRTDLRN